jgi:DNA uptake protein ComE-like DNA-binding protein
LFFAVILLLQGVYYFHDFSTKVTTSPEQVAWLSKQQELDRLHAGQKKYRPKLYPFNPNFITDYKGYALGMTVVEIDRLHAYRQQQKFVNSPAEFQAVTRVSDSLLRTMAPYFKFPDWVKAKKQYPTYVAGAFKKEAKRVVIDINSASKEDLMAVYGVGDKLSDRILAQKELLGAFVSMEQMADVWGLSPEVIDQMKTSFVVKTTANIKKININEATVKELSVFPFFRYALAKEIVIYRSMHGTITIEDLSKIKGFPVDKIKIIALYLEF